MASWPFPAPWNTISWSPCLNSHTPHTRSPWDPRDPVLMLAHTHTLKSCSCRDACLSHLYAAVGPKLKDQKTTGKYFHPIARETVPDLYVTDRRSLIGSETCMWLHVAFDWLWDLHVNACCFWLALWPVRVIWLVLRPVGNSMLLYDWLWDLCVTNRCSLIGHANATIWLASASSCQQAAPWLAVRSSCMWLHTAWWLELGPDRTAPHSLSPSDTIDTLSTNLAQPIGSVCGQWRRISSSNRNQETTWLDY